MYRGRRIKDNFRHVLQAANWMNEKTGHFGINPIPTTLKQPLNPVGKGKKTGDCSAVHSSVIIITRRTEILLFFSFKY